MSQKVLVNAGSYGIFAELIREELPTGQHEAIKVFGLDSPFHEEDGPTRTTRRILLLAARGPHHLWRPVYAGPTGTMRNRCGRFIRLLRYRFAWHRRKSRWGTGEMRKL
jgi:hypothetical protein